MSGPKDAPKPAHAKLTIFMTTLKKSDSVFIASAAATIATAATARRETRTSSLFEALFFTRP